MRQVAVAGIGMTKFGRSEKTGIELFAEAAMVSMTSVKVFVVSPLADTGEPVGGSPS